MTQDTKLCRDFMVTKLVTLSPRQRVFQGIGQLLKHKISGAPVVDGDRNFLGVFSEKCCMSVLTQAARLVASDTRSSHSRKARDIMVTRLVKLTPETDVFEAVDKLLRHNISGASVVDGNGNFLGVFSEKNSMSALIESAYAQLPTAKVEAFMNADRGRVIDPEMDLVTVAEIFLRTPYRRLVVLDGERLVGQVSRRDVLRAAHHISGFLEDREAAFLKQPAPIERSDNGDQATLECLLTTEIPAFMDTAARTIPDDTDLLTIAQVFLDTPHRRLPVVKGSKLVGQVSRRDVLGTTHTLIKPPSLRESSILYLSSLMERENAPFS